MILTVQTYIIPMIVATLQIVYGDFRNAPIISTVPIVDDTERGNSHDRNGKVCIDLSLEGFG